MNLHFTFNLDDTHIPFLDLLIIKNSNGTIGTNLYRKPTAGNTLLEASSAHPRPLVRSIPYAQYLDSAGTAREMRISILRLLFCVSDCYLEAILGPS